MVGLFFGMLAIAGRIVTAIGIRGYRTCCRAAAWPSVPGRAVRSEVVHKSQRWGGDLMWYYDPIVVYEYEVGGRRYESDPVAFVETRDNRLGPAEKRGARYPVGAHVEVFYDPHHPQEAVLDRGGMGLALVLMCAGPLATIAGIVAVVIWWQML